MALTTPIRRGRFCAFNFKPTRVWGWKRKSGRSSAWLERYLGVVEVASSNLVAPTKFLFRRTQPEFAGFFLRRAATRYGRCGELFSLGPSIADRIWVEDPPASSYPACIAVRAAELQSLEAGDLYLRRVREALMAQGRNVARRQVLLAVAAELVRDRPEALSLTRFEHDLASAAARKGSGRS